MGTRYGLEIRAAEAADAPGLAELMRAGGHAVPASELAARLEALRAERGTALIALEWGPPSGLVVLHRYRALEEAMPVARVTTLLVGPDDRRRGIGRLLLKAAAQAARAGGCGTLQIAAKPEDEALRGFCLATGFIEAGSLYQRPLRKKG